MRDSRTGSRGGPFALLCGVLIGFFLADMAMVIWRAPGLLRPSHLSGLGVLLLSALVLYIAMGVYFAAFYLMVWIISRILRLRFTSRALGLITALGAPLFLILQDNLQVKMLGLYMSPKTLTFYVPTLIALAAFIIAMVVIYVIVRRGRQAPAWVHGVFGWRGLIPIAFVVLVLYATIKIPPINVLGVFSEEEQHLSRTEHPPAAVQPAVEGPNFIILSIEAFRIDEFTQGNAPFLWELAQQNVQFPNYYIVSAATRPSVTSFFTSLYPVQHGCYNLGLGQTKRGEVPNAMSKAAQSIRALPMLLQERGYHTLMTTTNGLTADFMFGFEDVFHRYDAIEPYEFEPLSLDVFVGFRFLKNRLKGWRLHKFIVTPPDHSWLYFEAPRVNRTIERELGKHVTGEDQRPFFLFVHYIEPHTPYYRRPHPAIGLNLYSQGRRQSILAAYRDEIKAVDSAIAAIYAFLEANGLLKNTYLFVTADHGEEFGDHGEWGHGKSLYPEVIRTPAILVLPPGERFSRRVDALVENIDIVPTFAALADITPPDDWEGESLVPLLRPETDKGAQSDHRSRQEGPSIAYAQFFDERLSQWASAVTGGWQVIFRESRRLLEAPPEERRQHRKVMLFNLTDDPLAKEDVYGTGLDQEAGLVALLDGELRQLEATASRYQGEYEEIDQKTREQLRALGYID